MSRAAERRAETTAAAWWPAALAFLVIGGTYALVSDRLTLGPPWLLLVLLIAGVAGVRTLHWRGLWDARRWTAVGLLAIVTVAVAVSAVFLLQALLAGRTQAGELLRDAALLWVSNVLTFALWYWELDGGGPVHRHPGDHASSDFVFPQMMADRAQGWLPEFIDYLFLAFNTSTAFSPTDTMVLARRAKGLMMIQSIISLVTIAVLAARAINTLPS